MPWFRIDDGFHEHPKVERLEADPIEHALAVAAWTLCGTASARRLTDGVVTRGAVAKTLAAWPEKTRTKAVDALVRVGLWHEHEEGWRYHDWSEYQPSRETVLATRTDAAERARRSRRTRGLTPPARAEAVTPHVTPHVTRDVRDPCACPDPTRPDPTNSESESAPAPPAVDVVGVSERRIAEVRGYLVRGYQRRYEAETREAWMGLPRAGQHVGEVLAWVLVQADPIDAVDRLLDAVFATSRFRARRWPWAWIAEDPAAIAASSTAPSSSVPIQPLTFEEA